MKTIIGTIGYQQSKNSQYREKSFKPTFAGFLVAILVVAISPALARAGKFEALFVFGDSLSDPGNAAA